MRPPSDNAVKIEREELYELVWAEPMSRLATRYGISDVALKKICRRLEIPTPPRGYWARRSAGQPVDKPSLEKPSNPRAAGPCYIDPNWYRGEKYTLTPRRSRAEGVSPPEPVEVPAKLSEPHPLVLRTKEMLANILPRNGAVVGPADPGGLDIVVSRDQLDRALRIMDALVKALESKGYTVEASSELPVRTFVTVADEKLAIGLRENQMRVPHLLTPEERRKPYYGIIPQYDYVGAGDLSLEIVNLDQYYGLRVRKRWADGKKQRVEDCLGRFIEGLAVAATAIKSWREEQERERRRLAEERQRREEERRRREEEQRRREAEEARMQELVNEADAWAKSETIRAYLKAAAKRRKLTAGDIDPNGEFGQWLKWGHGVADRIDPLTRDRR